MRLFPDFDDNLRQAFRQETEMLVDSVIRENRSVLDLLRANYTFVNERLAKHYGIPNIYGSRFRSITFDEGPAAPPLDDRSGRPRSKVEGRSPPTLGNSGAGCCARAASCSSPPIRRARRR